MNARGLHQCLVQCEGHDKAKLERTAEQIVERAQAAGAVRTDIAAADVPARTDLSDRIAKDLKKHGFTFVGTTIVYAYLQAVGVVDDHLVGCGAKR